MIITLIGMPGCGKSSMSRAIAGKLKLKALDADKVIETKTGKKLHEIIDEVGVDGFKKLKKRFFLQSMKII